MTVEKPGRLWIFSRMMLLGTCSDLSGRGRQARHQCWKDTRNVISHRTRRFYGNVFGYRALALVERASRVEGGICRLSLVIAR